MDRVDNFEMDLTVLTETLTDLLKLTLFSILLPLLRYILRNLFD